MFTFRHAQPSISAISGGMTPFGLPHLKPLSRNSAWALGKDEINVFLIILLNAEVQRDSYRLDEVTEQNGKLFMP